MRAGPFVSPSPISAEMAERMTATARQTPSAAACTAGAEWLDRHAGRLMVLPAVIVLLCFAIFPLIVSAYLSLSRFRARAGRLHAEVHRLLNFQKLLLGAQQYHLLGTFGALGAVHWLVLALIAAALLVCASPAMSHRRQRHRARHPRPPDHRRARRRAGASRRVATIAPGGVPGTLVNTLLYVVVGVTMQFLLGLGLALLCAQADPRPQLLPRRSSSCR